MAPIVDFAAIERKLKHLKVWDSGPVPVQTAGRDRPWPKGENLPLTDHPVPDIA